MTGTQLDDPVLRQVRAARPGLPPQGDGLPPDAQAILETIVADASGRRREPTRGWVALASGLVVTLAVAAVAIVLVGHRHPAVSPSAAGGGTRLTAAQYALALGVDAVTSNPAGTTPARLLFDAEQVLRARCMRQRGLQYRIETFPAPAPLPSITGYPTTFYPAPTAAPYPRSTLVAVRARSGFNLTRDATSSGVADVEDKYVGSLSPHERSRWLAAWRGPHGCLTLAGSRLYGTGYAAAVDQSLPTLVYNHLTATVYTRSGAISPGNRPTAAAAAAWSRCMRRATGHSFGDEDALVAWLLDTNSPRRQRTDAFRRLEIHYALLDTRCAYSVGQPRVFNAAFRAAADHLPPSIRAQLQFVLDHQSQWVARARMVLAGGQP